VDLEGELRKPLLQNLRVTIMPELKSSENIHMCADMSQLHHTKRRQTYAEAKFQFFDLLLINTVRRFSIRLFSI